VVRRSKRGSLPVQSAFDRLLAYLLMQHRRAGSSTSQTTFWSLAPPKTLLAPSSSSPARAPDDLPRIAGVRILPNRPRALTFSFLQTKMRAE
jgi:hypothetical protein